MLFYNKQFKLIRFLLFLLVGSNVGFAQENVANAQTKQNTTDLRTEEAIFKNAMHYLSGDSLVRDPIEAVLLFRLAAEKGHAASQEQLALALISGHGVGQDSIEGAKWAKKAAHQGLVSAQYMLANLYYRGDGLRKDHEKAFYWFKKSADQGLVKSMVRMADMMIYGEGTPKNVYEGMFMYHRAAMNGDRWAEKRLAYLESQESCLLNASTLLFGRYLKCVSRKDFHFKLLDAGAILLTSSRNSRYIYNSVALNNGSDRMEIQVSPDKHIKRLVYYFDQDKDVDQNQQFLRLKNKLERKFGECVLQDKADADRRLNWIMTDNVDVILSKNVENKVIKLEYLVPDRPDKVKLINAS